MHSKKFPGNQEKRQNFNPPILPYKFGLIFISMKQKKIKKIWRKKFKTADFLQMAFFQNRQFLKIGPWITQLIFSSYRAKYLMLC